jgi:uncharacterized protein YbjT (DUF2867 family)
MDVVIIGAHGKIARHLTRLLAARGDRVRGVIRDPAQADDLRADGGEPVLCNIETTGVDELAGAVEGADAVVFAAGAGPGSGAARKWTVDRDGATKLITAAERTGVDRYLMISGTGAENPPTDDSVFSVYLRAKAEADQALAASGLSWTILRPVTLHDEPGDSRVGLTVDPVRGNVAREDVAAVAAAALHEPGAAHRTWYVTAGDTPIDTAVRTLAAG